jgi:cyclic beta-1,2-glucan synthetase
MDEQIRFLQKISRKTWAFFETFVGPEDHWLPPDNYQEHPVARVAHRTSPTNMGLALLANLSAYDFGYISTGRLDERTENALHTMAALERHRGHFYNWYVTQSLQPLLPKYISTVDSGNLAGHLLTLRAGLLALPDQPILGARWFDGLSHTLRIIVDTAAGAALAPLAQLQKDMASATDSRPATLAAARLCLDRLVASAMRCGITGIILSAPCKWIPPTSPSTCSRMAGSYTRPWPAACGRAAATTSRRAPSVSVINRRT